MAQHLVAWSEDFDSATLGRIKVVQDDVLTQDGEDRFFIPQEYRYIRWGAALGEDLTRGQIVTPSLQVRRNNLEVMPRNADQETFSLFSPQVMVPPRPIELRVNEQIEFQVAEDGSGATQCIGLVSLGPAELPPMPAGEIRVSRATGTTTLTARTWSTVTLTLDSSLEPGRYSIVGFYATGATVIAARLLITGQVFRPGLPGLIGAFDAASDFDPTIFDKLMFYNMGEFTQVNLPQMQFLATAADTAQAVVLYIIRIGDQ